MSKDLFAHKANSYDQSTGRVDNVNNIASAIINKITLYKSMHVMDFGSGTGLLLERIAPLVKKITAVDISSAMNRQLDEKISQIECDVEIIERNLERDDIDQLYDGIISSMTMHHIQDMEAMFMKFYKMVDDGGFIAICDVDAEDGSFHTEDSGVFHFGFDRNAIMDVAARVGFKNVEIETASVIHLPQGNYPVFLLTATR